MKTMIIMISVVLWSASVFAETRCIGIQVQKSTDREIRVTISSEVKEEDQKDLTMDQALAILQNAKGWGSTVFVGVEAHGLRPGEYLPLLKTISENVWLSLVFVEGRKTDFITDNIRKMIERSSAGAVEIRPKPEDVKEFIADPIPSSASEYFKDFKVTQMDLESVLKDYFQVEEAYWMRGYSHVAFADRTGHVILKDGRKLKWMVKPGGLAWLEFPSGMKMFLAKEK